MRECQQVVLWMPAPLGRSLGCHRSVDCVPKDNGSPSVAPGPAASVSSGGLLEMQIIGNGMMGRGHLDTPETMVEHVTKN